MSCALALDQRGRPHISYVDSSSRDLKYAWLVPPPLSLGKHAEPSNGLHTGDAVTYTLVLSGPGLSVRLWDPLPNGVRYVSDSITSPLAPAPVYSPAGRGVVWQGTLPTHTAQTVRFQVALGVAGTGSLLMAPPIANTAWLADPQNQRSVWAVAVINGQHVYLPLVAREF